MQNPMEEEEDDQACLFAMLLASASVLPMVLKTAIELDLLEIMKKASPGAFITASELAQQLPIKNPDQLPRLSGFSACLLALLL